MPCRHRRRQLKRLDAELVETVAILAKDEPLPRRYFDHAPGGLGWSGSHGELGL
jgi:mRNA-degrading endonuclease YafQ of YafQ-DinJ toxin-antitoxin module